MISILLFLTMTTSLRHEENCIRDIYEAVNVGVEEIKVLSQVWGHSLHFSYMDIISSLFKYVFLLISGRNFKAKVQGNLCFVLYGPVRCYMVHT